MRVTLFAACAFVVATQATSGLQEKEPKTVRVIVFSPQVPGTADGKVAKLIKNGTFTAIEVVEAKATAVKVTDITAGKKEKPTQETYQRQKISVTANKEAYNNVDVFFATPMTKGFKLTNFVERGTFTGKLHTLMAHHYIIYEA
ncbi:MAG: hypothetical protein HY289_01295, partial [Planctomycetes bacterium]|nr:hypothetical protein [Planctomycetota bacterium]